MEASPFGDYRPLRPLAEHPSRTTWLAEQVSVGREVVVIELTDLSQRESFLADVRAQAGVDHPLVGSVYEAVSEDERCFVALERLPGETLAARLEKRALLRPVELAHVLRRVAEAALYLIARDAATEPFVPGAIHFDEHGVVRIENILRAGQADPEAARADIVRLGNNLPPLVTEGHPGASRVLTLLAWMRGDGLGRSLTWEEIRGYAQQIETQLAEPASPIAAPPTSRVRRKKRSPVVAAAVLTGSVAALVAAALFLQSRETIPPPVPPPMLPPPVLIEAGEYPAPDGGTGHLPAFMISAHEVTIGEYLAFLETLDQLGPDERVVFDHANQPATKSGHQPDDWENLLAAADGEALWNGREVDLLCPIVNIDWWDAAAYCRWKGCRLPTQEEWFAALRQKLDDPSTLTPADWGPVTSIDRGDRTPNKLWGMAGSVAEWTRRPALQPANPLGEPKPVIIGGSYLSPAAGALAREWVDDRLLRRPDLGFRVVLPLE